MPKTVPSLGLNPVSWLCIWILTLIHVHCGSSFVIHTASNFIRYGLSSSKNSNNVVSVLIVTCAYSRPNKNILIYYYHDSDSDYYYYFSIIIIIIIMIMIIIIT